ncbi:MAG TPA: hypothetical protein VKR06_40075 [Ktedonosporobacter sp.]|nr:hypothetical protein [Ktedonosporobacter sp.]
MNSQDVDGGGVLCPLDELDEQYSETMGLVIILERLRTCFKRCVDAEDMELLGFSLHHLFYGVNTLYQSVLPNLTACTAHIVEIETTGCQYCLWLHLQEVKRLLERIEPLCRLLNGAIISILDSLDALRRLGGEQKATRKDEGREKDQCWQQTMAQERWELALSVLTDRLNSWHQYHTKRLSFTIQFTNLLPHIPTLAHMDTAFDLLLDNAGAIFGEILQDFQAISIGDDEAMATLLLDLMQKVDQLLLQIDILVEPLHMLIRYYAIGAETR